MSWFMHSIRGCYKFVPVFTEGKVIWKCAHPDCGLAHVRDLRGQHVRS